MWLQVHVIMMITPLQVHVIMTITHTHACIKMYTCVHKSTVHMCAFCAIKARYGLCDTIARRGVCVSWLWCM